MPLNSRKSAAARTLEPGPLPTIDNSPQQATFQCIDIDRRIDDLYLYLLYILRTIQDYLFAEIWLALRQLRPASGYQGAPANDTFTIKPSKGLDHCIPAVNSSQSPTHGITSRHADKPLYNRKLACNWLSEEGSGTCNQQFGSRRDLMCHLNHAHGVKGPAKREICCRWLLNPDGSLMCGRHVRRAGFSRHIDVHVEATFMCSYRGCKKSYSRQDVLQKHIIKAHHQ
ncbi:hypothetical protein EDC04DRAFT_2601536 [Pisolithus marmoratus]|nr:hypothetical protein EDC04DRAFT_2601536 [Pisolithus marmoratus]